jgi:hypothetical protein
VYLTLGKEQAEQRYKSCYGVFSIGYNDDLAHGIDFLEALCVPPEGLPGIQIVFSAQCSSLFSTKGHRAKNDISLFPAKEDLPSFIPRKGDLVHGLLPIAVSGRLGEARRWSSLEHLLDQGFGCF